MDTSLILQNSGNEMVNNEQCAPHFRCFAFFYLISTLLITPHHETI